MNRFSVDPTTLPLLKLYSMIKEMNLSPDYQRPGSIWDKESRQYLIDSIINGFPIPPIFLHAYDSPHAIGGAKFRWAVIDGKQRLQALQEFIDGEISLDENFEFMKNEEMTLQGLGYVDLAKKFPKIKLAFDNFPIHVTLVHTDEMELIQEMFLRLNEAVPLRAAEKRNAFPGPLPGIVREIAKHVFFTAKLPIKNNRYQHYDLVTKFLLAEDRGKPASVKKDTLDSFTRSFVGTPAQAEELRARTVASLDMMAPIFEPQDRVLRSSGLDVVYYLLFMHIKKGEWTKPQQFSRQAFVDLESVRQINREYARAGDPKARFSLILVDQFMQKNDEESFDHRLKVLKHFIEHYDPSSQGLGYFSEPELPGMDAKKQEAVAAGTLDWV